MGRTGGHTFVVWLKLGEFLRRSVLPISERGRPLPFVGEAVGVLFMRSGDTCGRASVCHMNTIEQRRVLDARDAYRFVARHAGGWCCCVCSAAKCVVEECLRRMQAAPAQMGGKTHAQRINGCGQNKYGQAK
jgi:hypothetical protein